MAKEIVTTTWCDACMEEDRREPGQEYGPLSLSPSSKPRTLDLCEVHHKQLLQPLQEALSTYGRTAQQALVTRGRPTAGRRPHSARADEAPGPFYCLVPGCTGYNRDGYRDLSRLKGHLRAIHKVPFEEYVDTYGEPVPGAQTPAGQEQQLDLPASEEPTVLVCGIDGCEKSYSSVTTPRVAQAMGSHRSQAHGIRTGKHHRRQQPA